MSYLQELNPVQRKAVEAVNGPVMIVAGAGSGKTRVLTYRVAHLISSRVPPYDILALTFTNKAANEMRERIAHLVGGQARDIWMGTFHSTFARILRREAETIGYTRTFTIYDSEDSLNVIRQCMADLGLSLQQYKPHAFRALISKAKNNLVHPDEYQRTASDYISEKVGQVFEQYVRRMRLNNSMDFDDLLIKPIELFEKKKSVLEKYKYRFKFVLIDEFQDTNRAQYVVTKMLTERYKNICVVGDDAQSIYAFRGADIRNILDFAKDYPECATFRLEQNYRSTKSILHAAGRLIEHNNHQIPKALWTENAQGDPITVVSCADDRDEGLQVVRNVKEEIQRRKLALRDFAVLYRTNAQSRAIEDEFRREGIPYVIVGGVRFYERKEIKDVLAYLRLLTNERDDESFRRVINYPSRGLGGVSLDHLQEYAASHTISLAEAAGDYGKIAGLTDRARVAISGFIQFIEKYRLLAEKMSMSELARSLVDELGILRSYKEEGTPEAMARWENVQELLSAISEFSDTREDASMAQFLEEVSLISDVDSWEGTKNAVTLMTLHSSKGLEFPVVFITGLEENLLPFSSGTLEQSELEEERRLFYVGITRAQQKLYLLHTRTRYRFGDLSFPVVSQFVSELGDEACEMRSSQSLTRASAFSKGLQGAAVHRARKSPKHRADESAYHRDEMPDYESESQLEMEIKRGTIVIHETFGRGKVLDVSGRGESQKASVQFDEFGVKNLVLKFARLRPGS
ncbi:MAG: DNA helicase [Ignavibacteria bacterium]|nr:DNA helicase [Ignavibacteria bacterium]